VRTKQYPGIQAEVNSLVNELHTFFIHKGYEVQDVHEGSNVVVQARKAQKYLEWFGFSYALTVIITVDDAGTSVTIGGGKWLDKAAIGIGLFAISGGLLAIVPAAAAFQQHKIAEETWHVVIKHMARQTTPLTCSKCGSAVGGKIRFCPQCGTELNSRI
jgi:hypothetical protein